MIRKFIGDKAFYRRVLAVALPIIVQNGITNFVSLLDNIMIGQVGTLQMSGVAIVNQLMFVFNLCIFGAVSGAGIFTAQYFGSENHEGVRHTFRFKLLVGVLLTILGISVFLAAGNPLIELYLQGDGDPLHALQTLAYGHEYLLVMLWGLPAFALSTAYSSTLREGNQTMVPMVAGICAVFVNLCLNYVLIFGHLGFPKMGIQGAALATVIARYAELAIVAGWTHINKQKNPFIQGAYRSMHIPGHLLGQIMLRNETASRLFREEIKMGFDLKQNQHVRHYSR
jgi:putative MATE family efflux protein